MMEKMMSGHSAEMMDGMMGNSMSEHSGSDSLESSFLKEAPEFVDYSEDLYNNLIGKKPFVIFGWYCWRKKPLEAFDYN